VPSCEQQRVSCSDEADTDDDTTAPLQALTTWYFGPVHTGLLFHPLLQTQTPVCGVPSLLLLGQLAMSQTVLLPVASSSAALVRPEEQETQALLTTF
jgi:hypothetical protein